MVSQRRRAFVGPANPNFIPMKTTVRPNPNKPGHVIIRHPKRSGNNTSPAQQYVYGLKNEAMSYIVDKVIESAGNQASNLIDKVKNSNKANEANPTPAGLAFPGHKGNPTSNGSYALSKAPNPKRISLNSGVRPNTFANDYMAPVVDQCSPLHMSIVNFVLPVHPTNPLSGYIANTLCFDIQTRAQANVGFDLDINTSLSSLKIVKAFNAVISALQTYFYYSSILSYESDSRNKNAGMIALRSKIDSAILSDLVQLGRRLEDTPIPPRIVEWMRYMNGNFLSGDTQGSPIIKFGIDIATMTGTTVAVPTLPAVALSNLASSDNNTVYTLLRRAIPQWRVGTLYDCPTTPTYDKNFVTIFANAGNVCYPTASVTRSNIVPGLTTSTPYNSFNNNLDGLAFCMANVYQNSNNTWFPGICVPAEPTAAIGADNRLSYYGIGTAPKDFIPVVNTPFLALSRCETTIPNAMAGNLYTPHLSGSERCQAVTGNSLIQTAQNALDFLFNVNSIPYNGKISNFNKKS